MPRDILAISDFFIWITNLLALAIGIAFCYRGTSPYYLRVFPIYLLVSILAEFLANDYFHRLFHMPPPFGRFQPIVKAVSYDVFTIFELFAFSWFYFKVIESRLVKRLLAVLLMLFCLFFIISYLKSKNIAQTAIILECIIIIIPCLAWYRELFNRHEPTSLVRQPAFWLVSGIFFYLATIFPLFVALSYLTIHESPALVFGLYSINNFAIGITYLLFIKGFTCRTSRL